MRLVEQNPTLVNRLIPASATAYTDFDPPWARPTLILHGAHDMGFPDDRLAAVRTFLTVEISPGDS